MVLPPETTRGEIIRGGFEMSRESLGGHYADMCRMKWGRITESSKQCFASEMSWVCFTTETGFRQLDLRLWMEGGDQRSYQDSAE